MPGFLPLRDLEGIAALLGENVSRFDGARILICGGGGFLGRYFVSLFTHLNSTVFQSPCEVLVLDNRITEDVHDGAAMGDLPNVTFIEQDIIREFHWEEPLDYIIQAAGIASPYYYRKYPLETLEVATLGTKNMLRLAQEHGVQGFLFFSSSEIYGDPDPEHVPTAESYRGNVSCLGPRACYDESKRLGETLCKIFQDKYGVPTKIVRPFNVYGPGISERDYRVLPAFASRIAFGRPLRIYKPGTQTRTYCYVSDAINGFIRALLNGISGEPYNIGNSAPEITVLDLAEKLMTVAERRVEVQVVEHPDAYPADEPMRRCPDITKAHLQLGYQPTVGLTEGLGWFMEWANESYEGAA